MPSSAEDLRAVARAYAVEAIASQRRKGSKAEP